MAKKSSRSGSKKHYPVQSKIRVAPPSPGLGNTKLVARLDRIASISNHRLYRQSRYYNASVSLDVDVAVGDFVDVYVLRDTWMLQKAYQTAKAIYDENVSDERDRIGQGNLARWNDFRVNHGLSGVTEVYPWVETIDILVSGPLATGEYQVSQLADAAGATKLLRFEGSAGAFNIIDEYDLMGNTDSTPATALVAAGYDGLEDDIDDATVDHLTDDGNLPPYDRTNISNNVWIRVARLFVGSGGQQKLSTGNFCAPAGLVVFALGGSLNDLTIGSRLTIDVKKGDYKGLDASSMLE